MNTVLHPVSDIVLRMTQVMTDNVILLFRKEDLDSLTDYYHQLDSKESDTYFNSVVSLTNPFKPGYVWVYLNTDQNRYLLLAKLAEAINEGRLIAALKES